MRKSVPFSSSPRGKRNSFDRRSKGKPPSSVCELSYQREYGRRGVYDGADVAAR